MSGKSTEGAIVVTSRGDSRGRFWDGEVMRGSDGAKTAKVDPWILGLISSLGDLEHDIGSQ